MNKNIECAKLMSVLLDRIAYAIIRFREGSDRELKELETHVLPSALGKESAEKVMSVIMEGLERGDAEIDIVVSAYDLLFEKCLGDVR